MAALLTNAGKAWVQHRLKGDASYNAPGYVAWGTTSGAVAATQSTIAGESGSRAATTVTVQTTTTTDDTIKVVGTLTNATGSTATYYQGGVLDAAAAGNLILAADVNPSVAANGVALNNGDSILFTYTWQLN